MTLEFSEAVSVSLGGVRVFDSSGTRVDRGNSLTGETASDVVVGLEDGLADGTYVVTWRVISADSHPIHGGFVFSIGTPSHIREGLLDSLLDQQGDTSWQAVGAVLRGIAYAGLLLAAGGSVVLAWFGLERDRRRQPRASSPPRPASARSRCSPRCPCRPCCPPASGIGSITEPGVLDQVLGDGVGLSVLLAVVGAALLAMAARVPVNPTTRVVTALGALAGGRLVRGRRPHPARPTRPGCRPWPTPRTLWAGAVWFGGLVVLALALRRRRTDPDPVDAATLVQGFSGIAGIALLVVAAAGGALAWGEVRAVRAVTSTTYGWLLVAKTAIVALVAAGRGLQPVPAGPRGRRRARHAGDGWRHLRRTVALRGARPARGARAHRRARGRHAGQDRGRHRQHHVGHDRARHRHGQPHHRPEPGRPQHDPHLPPRRGRPAGRHRHRHAAASSRYPSRGHRPDHPHPDQGRPRPLAVRR